MPKIKNQPEKKQKEVTVDLNLENIGLGAVTEKFDDELFKVIGNILDPNTEVKTIRKITIDVKIKPNPDDRELCQMEVSVSSKLAPTKTLVSQLSVGLDRKTGEVNAVESVPQQRSLFPDQDKSGKVVNMK